ncbi:MAG TPA: hypothetical protein VFH70_11920 [Acidimicrobiales bacterium]|nr:hypothetical protein [Acidimicrobiales bacterium]
MPRITEHYVTDPDLTDAVAQKAAPDPASLYTEASEQLEKALDTLDHQLGRLYIRLTPALTYDPGSNEITAFTPAHEPDGQIVDQLTRTTNRIQTIIDTIHNIHRRLTLPHTSE